MDKLPPDAQKMEDDRLERMHDTAATQRSQADALADAPIESLAVLRQINEGIQTLNDKLDSVVEVLHSLKS